MSRVLGALGYPPQLATMRPPLLNHKVFTCVKNSQQSATGGTQVIGKNQHCYKSQISNVANNPVRHVACRWPYHQSTSIYTELSTSTKLYTYTNVSNLERVPFNIQFLKHPPSPCPARTAETSKSQ